MARFNPTLQTQGGVIAPAQQPNAATALASAGEQALGVFSNLMEMSKNSEAERRQSRVASVVENVYALDQDLLNSGMKGVRREQKVNEALINSLSDPRERLAARQQLAQMRGGFIGGRIESAQQDERTQYLQGVENNYNLIPQEFKSAYVRPNSEGVTTTDEKVRVFSEYQKFLAKNQEAEEQKKSALENVQDNQYGAVNQFAGAVQTRMDTVLAVPVSNFYESVTSIDPNSPEASTMFANAKTQARESASQMRLFINSQYQDLINAIDDEDVIKLAEKRRDAALQVVEDFITDLEASSLDQMKNKKDLYDSLTLDQSMPSSQAIGEAQRLQSIYGDAYSPLLMRSVATDQSLQDEISSGITGMLDMTKIQSNEENAQANDGYTSQSQFKTGYVARKKGLDRMEGVVDETYTDGFLKNFVWAVDYAEDGNVSVSDMRKMLDDVDTSAFEWQLNQTTERNKQSVENRVNALRLSVMSDRTDGDVAMMLQKPYISWDRERKTFVFDEAKARPQESTFSTGLNTPASVRRRKQEFDSFVERFNQSVEVLRERGTEGDSLYRYFNLPI